jgi:hypothetical protein
MPSRNWSSDFALGLIAPCALVLGFLLVLWSSGRDFAGCAYRNQKNYQPTQEQVGTVAPDAINSQLSCRDDRAQNDDKCQAWRQAEAAERQACIAHTQFLVGSLISVFGLVGLFMTIRYTADSAKAASEAARETARSANAQIQADAALLFVEKILFDEAYPHTVTAVFRNAGKTPAYVAGHRRELLITADELSETPTFSRKFTVEPDTLIEAGGTYTVTGYTSTPMTEVFDSNVHAYFFGHVIYMDVFGNGWQAGFGRWTEGNRLAALLSGTAPSRLLYWRPIHQDGYNYRKKFDEDGNA